MSGVLFADTARVNAVGIIGRFPFGYLSPNERIYYCVSYAKSYRLYVRILYFVCDNANNICTITIYIIINAAICMYKCRSCA